MFRVLLRLLADAMLVGLLLFVSAGTLGWWRAWALLALLLGTRLTTALAVYRVHPALLEERAKLPIHGDQPRADRLLVLLVLATGFLGLPVIAGLDVFRWRLLPPPPPLLADLGLVLFALGWGIKGLALHTNAFATSVVRVQRERQHDVVDTGIYSIVRHPFYSGTLLVLIGIGLGLGSYTAALCAFVPIALVVVRVRLEERYLRRELPAYRAYTQRVRHRLLPGFW